VTSSRWVRFKRKVAEAFGNDRYSRFALNDLDRKLRMYLDFRGGFFIEAGANDGLRQSNTYWLERFRAWRGGLIEGIPELAQACRRNRPKAMVYNAALVGDDRVREVTMKTAGLMSIVVGAFGSEPADLAHVERGVAVQGGPDSVSVREVRVPARTLTAILSELGAGSIDLLSLDVEGFELEALRGLDLERFRPRFVLVEARSVAEVDELLAHHYRRIDQLSYHDYLYAQLPGQPQGR
jgi:FkbM family methyltransferase